MERRVAGYEVAFDPDSWLSSCVFDLGERFSTENEQRLALRSWSEQVIRNGRDQRAKRRLTLDRHRQLTQELRETRLSLVEARSKGGAGEGPD